MITTGILSSEFGYKATRIWWYAAAVTAVGCLIELIRQMITDPGSTSVLLFLAFWLLVVPATLGISEDIMCRKRNRAVRIVNDACGWWNWATDLSQNEIVRKVLRGIALEMQAVEKLNPSRNDQLEEEFRKLFEAAKNLDLISDYNWDEYFAQRFELRSTRKAPISIEDVDPFPPTSRSRSK